MSLVGFRFSSRVFHSNGEERIARGLDEIGSQCFLLSHADSSTNERMSQSIDVRINDLITEYLDYKGYRKTVDAFREERTDRQEPIDRVTNGKTATTHEDEQIKLIQVRRPWTKMFDEWLFSRSRSRSGAFSAAFRSRQPRGILRTLARTHPVESRRSRSVVEIIRISALHAFRHLSSANATSKSTRP